MADARLFVSAADPVSGGSRHTFEHPLARPVGTLICADFSDARTNSLPVAALTAGATLRNLGDPIEPDLVMETDQPNKLTNTGTAIQGPAWVSGNIQQIVAAATGYYNQNLDFHLHVVFSLPNDAGSSTIQFGNLFTFGTASNNSLFWMDSGNLGRAPRVFVKSIAGSTTAKTVTGFALGAAQIVDVLTFGTDGYVFLNGTQLVKFTVAGIPDLSTARLKILGGRDQAKVWRIMLENLAAVTAYEAALGRTFTPAQAVAEAYAVSSAASYT